MAEILLSNLDGYGIYTSNQGYRALVALSTNGSKGAPAFGMPEDETKEPSLADAWADTLSARSSPASLSSKIHARRDNETQGPVSIGAGRCLDKDAPAAAAQERDGVLSWHWVTRRA